MPVGDLKYVMKCLVCGKQFSLPNIESVIPKHPIKGLNPLPNTPYVPCGGSGQVGVFVKTGIVGID